MSHKILTRSLFLATGLSIAVGPLLLASAAVAQDQPYSQDQGYAPNQSGGQGQAIHGIRATRRIRAIRRHRLDTGRRRRMMDMAHRPARPVTSTLPRPLTARRRPATPAIPLRRHHLKAMTDRNRRRRRPVISPARKVRSSRRRISNMQLTPNNGRRPIA
jgi:hypothetical protein